MASSSQVFITLLGNPILLSGPALLDTLHWRKQPPEMVLGPLKAILAIPVSPTLHKEYVSQVTLIKQCGFFPHTIILMR